MSFDQSDDDSLLLLNCRIINFNEVVNNDIYIENGVIKQLGRQLTQRYPDTKKIDIQGRIVMPGGIDPMTHICQGIKGDATADDVFTATRMAIAGGTTTIIEAVHCPKRSSLLAKFEKQKSLFENDSCCDFGFHVSLTEFNQDVEKEMKLMVNSHGVNSFQMFTGYYQDSMLEDDELFSAMRACRKVGALAMVQAENGRFIAKKESLMIEKGISGPEGFLYARSDEMEAEAAGRVICIANQASCPLILSPVACDLVGRRLLDAQKDGKIVQGYCTIASICLMSSKLLASDWHEAAAHVCSPPLRGKESQDNLIGFLAKGTIAMCASSHSCFRTDQLEVGLNDFRLIPQGIGGVHERLSVLWEKAVVPNIMDPTKFVLITSTMPAKIFGLFPKKGLIAVGSDADLIIWNPNIAPVRRQFSSKCLSPGVGLNVYERITVSAGPSMIFLRGKEVARSVSDGRLELILLGGQGRYIPRASFPQLMYAPIFANEKKIKETRVSRDGESPYHRKSLTEKIGQIHDNHDQTSSPTGDGVKGRQSAFSNSDDIEENRVLPKNNQQASGFNLNGAQTYENQPQRPSIRTLQPPGGRSSGLW